MATLDEKPAPSPAPASPPIPVASSYFNPISPFFNAYDRFASWRRDLGLPHPGSVENIGKEVKGESSSVSPSGS
jgi:mitochondrial import receptor subunit TOM40